MPAVPSETIRVVLPGGLEVNGEFLPEGVLVASTLWPLHQSDKAFRGPWIYRRERWMSDEASGVSKEDVSRAQSIFSPFVTGPVNCLGQKLAKLILLITIAKTLYQMEVLALPKSLIGGGEAKLRWGMRDENVFQVRDAFISLTDGPLVVFKHRSI
jgi:cytochrome P450